MVEQWALVLHCKKIGREKAGQNGGKNVTKMAPIILSHQEDQTRGFSSSFKIRMKNKKRQNKNRESSFLLLCCSVNFNILTNSIRMKI